jgi:cell division septal protein FtsQ
MVVDLVEKVTKTKKKKILFIKVLIICLDVWLVFFWMQDYASPPLVFHK